MRHIGVARIFDWGGGPNRKSHAMTSSQFFEEELFMGQRYRRMEGEKLGTGLASNLGFASGKGLGPEL